MNEQKTLAQRLGKDTLIPMGVAAAMMVSLCGGAVWLNMSLAQLQYQTELLRRDISSLSERISSNAQDRWRRTDMRAWARLLQATNPALKIPEPD